MPSVHHKREARTKQQPQKITRKKYDSKKKASILARIDGAHVFERDVSLCDDFKRSHYVNDDDDKNENIIVEAERKSFHFEASDTVPVLRALSC